MCSIRAGRLIRILSLFLVLFTFGCGGGGGGDDGDDPKGGGEATLTIVSTSPSNGSLGVPRDVQIDITFSQAIDPNSLTDGSVTLSTKGVTLPVALTLLQTGNVLRLSPNFPLAGATLHTVTVTTAVRDQQGNFLSSDQVFSFTTADLPVLGQWTKVSAGRDNGMALNENGTVWAWGCNVDGQIGNGVRGGNGDNNEDLEKKHLLDVKTPVQVGSYPDGEWISSGDHVSFAIMNGSRLWAWGNGFLGNGTKTSFTPVETGNGTGWAQVETSMETQFTCAIKTDGTLWSWGSNYYGQLGNGQGGDLTSIHNTNAPGQVNNESGWVMVAAGGGHAVAVKSDNTLWAWGSNQFGQLGNGTNGSPTLNPDGSPGEPRHDHDANAPVRVGTDSDWAFVFAKGDFTLAIKRNGSLWAWGLNNDGQLGIGTQVNVNTPTRVGTDANWSYVAPGKNHTAAIKNDGSLWTWGSNGSGQLGSGGTPSRSAPARVGTDLWRTLSSGMYFTLGIRNDGTLWSWGLGKYYRLGTGSANNEVSPRQIQIQ